MIAGCYDLHLYCDGLGCEAGQYKERKTAEYTHEFGSKARAMARRAGWKIRAHEGVPNVIALCPSCVKRGAQTDPAALA